MVQHKKHVITKQTGILFIMGMVKKYIMCSWQCTDSPCILY